MIGDLMERFKILVGLSNARQASFNWERNQDIF